MATQHRTVAIAPLPDAARFLGNLASPVLLTGLSQRQAEAAALEA
jgi:hypothetical protein